MDNNNNKGKLLHQTSDEVYEYYKEKDLSKRNEVLFIGILVIIISFLFVFLKPLLGYPLELGWNLDGFVLIMFSILSILGIIIIIECALGMYNGRMDRIKVYENGFTTPRKPYYCIRNHIERYIEFLSIENIQYSGSSGCLVVSLKNGEQIWLSAFDDFKALRILSEMLSVRFPDVPIPNLDVIRDYINAHASWANGEISKEEMMKSFTIMQKTNARFDPPGTSK